MFGYGSSGEPLIAATRGYDPVRLREFEEHYGVINPWAEGFASQPVGSVLSTGLMCPDEKLMTTEFYADWVLPQNDLRRGGGGVFGRSDQAVALIGANIEARNGDLLEDQWLELVRLIMPLLRTT